MQEDRQRLQRWLVERAEVGAPGGKELLEMTPCDLFTYLRGRTLWLVGDSMMQAGSPSSGMIPLAAFLLEHTLSRVPWLM